MGKLGSNRRFGLYDNGDVPRPMREWRELSRTIFDARTQETKGNDATSAAGRPRPRDNSLPARYDRSPRDPKLSGRSTDPVARRDGPHIDLSFGLVLAPPARTAPRDRRSKRRGRGTHRGTSNGVRGGWGPVGRDEVSRAGSGYPRTRERADICRAYSLGGPGYATELRVQHRGGGPPVLGRTTPFRLAATTGEIFDSVAGTARCCRPRPTLRGCSTPTNFDALMERLPTMAPGGSPRPLRLVHQRTRLRPFSGYAEPSQDSDLGNAWRCGGRRNCTNMDLMRDRWGGPWRALYRPGVAPSLR